MLRYEVNLTLKKFPATMFLVGNLGLVVELAYTKDLKPFAARLVGSNPT